MANPLQIRFIATANTAPLVTGLNAIRTAAQGAMMGVSTSVHQVQSPLNKLTADVQKGRLTWQDYRRSLRATNAIITENNAITNATAVAMRNASGSATVHMKIIRGTAASYATLGQQMMFVMTATRAFGKNLIAVGKNIQWAGRQVMVGITLPLLALGAVTTKFAEDYNREMTKVVKVTNLTRVRMEDEFGKMQEVYQAGLQNLDGTLNRKMQERMSLAISSIERQTARLADLGATMGFVAQETATLTAEFAQMGFAGVALDGMTEAALRLSRVGGTELPEAMNLTRLAAMAFGKQLGEGDNSLIETFARLNLIENNTSLSLEEMAGAIPIVAGVAKNLGIEIETLGGMLALMSDKGIDAREGATSLRTGLIRLVQDATDPSIAAFDKLGISITDLQQKHRGSVFGLINELAQQLHRLQNATEGSRQKTDEFIAAIGKMVGTRAAARFTSMLEGIGDDIEMYTENVAGVGEVTRFRLKEGLDQTSDAFRAMGPAIIEANKAMAQFKYEEDRVNQSLAGQAEIIRARLNVALVRLGESMLPLRNKIMEFVVKMIEGFNALSERVRTFIGVIVGIFAVLGPLTMIFGVFANAIGQILVLFTRLSKTFKFTTASMQAENLAFAGNTASVNAAVAAKNSMVASNTALVASTTQLTAAVIAQNAAFTGGISAGRAGAASRGARVLTGGARRKRDGTVIVGQHQVDARRSASQGAAAARGSRGTKMDRQGNPITEAAIMASMVAMGIQPMSASAAMRTAITPEKIMSFLPKADADLMRTKTLGGQSLLELTRAQLSKEIGDLYNAPKSTPGGAGGRGNFERFAAKNLTQHRVEQALLSAGINVQGLPQSAREIAGLPQRLGAGDVVRMSKEQRMGLNKDFGGKMKLGGRMSIRQIEDAARAAGISASAVRSSVEKMVGSGSMPVNREVIGNERMIKQDRDIARRQATASLKEGSLGKFDDFKSKEARAAVAAEQERLLKQARPHAATPAPGMKGKVDQASKIMQERGRQAKEVFRGRLAPTTDFQKGLASGRNAALSALMMFPKLLLSPFTLLKMATVGLVKNFFGLKLAIDAIVSGTAAFKKLRSVMKAAPIARGAGRALSSVGQSMAAQGRGLRAGASSIAQSAGNAVRSARSTMRGREGGRLGKIMGPGFVRARQGIGAPTTIRGIGQRISERFRGGTAGTATTDRLVRLRQAQHRQTPLRGMLGLRGGRGAGNAIEGMGRVFRKASDAVTAFTAAVVAAQSRLVTALGGMARAVSSIGKRVGQSATRTRSRGGEMLSRARRNIRTLPLLAGAAQTKIRDSSRRMARTAERIRSGRAFRESNIGRRMRSVGVPTTVRGMAGRARDHILRRPTAGRMETSARQIRLQKALGGSLIERTRIEKIVSKQIARINSGFAKMRVGIARTTAAINTMRVTLIASVKSFATAALAASRSFISSAKLNLKTLPLLSAAVKTGLKEMSKRALGSGSSAARRLVSGQSFREGRIGRRMSAVGIPTTMRGMAARARDRALRRPTAGRMESRQMSALRDALIRQSRGPGFMERARVSASAVASRARGGATAFGKEASSKFNSAIRTTAERFRALQIATISAAASLRAFTANVIASSRAALASSISFGKAKSIALAQGVRGLGSRIASGGSRMRQGVSGALSRAREARSAAVGSGQGVFGRVRARASRSATGMVDRLAEGTRMQSFRRGYMDSMSRQGQRAIDQGRHTGRHAAGTQGISRRTGRMGNIGGQMMSRAAVGRATAGAAGTTRAVAAGATVALKSAFMKAVGALIGAKLVLAIPLLISFGAAAAANPEQFKKNMMSIFAKPLESLKAAWDDFINVIKRLFAAMRSGGDNEGSKFVEFAGKVTGILGTILSTAFQAVITGVTFLIETFAALFALMRGDGEGAAKIMDLALLRLRTSIMEMLASLLEMLAKVPGIKQLFGGMLNDAADSLRARAAANREEIEALEHIPNAIANIQIARDKDRASVKKHSQALSEANTILSDLIDYQIMEQSTLDRLIGSVTKPVAQIEIDASIVPRFENEGDLNAVFRAINESYEDQAQMQLDAIAGREEAVNLAYDEIVAMENLTDEQKQKLAFAVATAAIEADAAELNNMFEELRIRLEAARRTGAQNINLERERELALIHLATMATIAQRAGDEDRVAELRAQAQAMVAAGNTQQGAELTSIALNEIMEDFGKRRLALEEETNRQISLRTQLQGREKAMYEEAQEDMEEAMEDARAFMGAFQSAMGEVMGDIGSAISRVIEKQSDAISKLFDDTEDGIKDYFSNFTEQFTTSMDKLRDAIEEQANEEESSINDLADLAVEKIEKERELEEKLENERQRYFAREKARIDFLSGRRTGTIQVEEAMARGQIGEAAILQIKMQTDAQQYYVDQLQDNENRLMELREEARDNEINRIEKQRDLELEILEIRTKAALEQADETEAGTLTESDSAEAKALEVVNQAREQISSLTEEEGFLRENFLREWNRITPATEEEYRKHMQRLLSFMDESDARMAGGVNQIQQRMVADLALISQQFGTTVDLLMADLNISLDGSDFAVKDFTNSLLATTSQTLLSVLQAFEGFNSGLQAGYSNGVALSQAFMEIFQRDIDATVEWARSLASMMVAEDEKWKEAGEQLAESWGSGFKTEMDRILKEVESRVSQTQRNVASSIAALEGILGTGTPFMTPPHDFSYLNRLTNPGFFFGPDRPRPVLPGPRPPAATGPRPPAATGPRPPRTTAPGISDYITMPTPTYSRYMHSGGLVGKALRPDEIPAILQKGEYVLQKSAVSAAGVDFLNSLNSSSAMFSVPKIPNLNIDSSNSQSPASSTNTYNLSFKVDGGNIDEQKLAQKVVFEIKKMERAGGGGRRV